MVKTASLEALVKLMDDPDEAIYSHVKNELFHCGQEVVPFLESSWEHLNYGAIFQSRIESLIHEIQFESIKSDIEAWVASSEKDLLSGVCIISRIECPGINQTKIEEQLLAIQRKIWLELNPNLTAFETVKVFNKILFEVYGFTGDSKNYSSPSNSCIQHVLDSKKGNPLSISVIYSILAQRLSIPIFGVNLPNHFILAYMDQNQSMQELEIDNASLSNSGVFFYINPFSKGTLFSKTDIDDFLVKINVSQRKEYYEPCSNSAILVRMLNNLISAYSEKGNAEKVNELIELRDCF